MQWIFWKVLIFQITLDYVIADGGEVNIAWDKMLKNNIVISFE